MSETAYRIVSGITVAVSIASICSSLYIVASWKKLKKTHNNDLIHDYVMYMSICDIMFVLLRGLGLTNPAFNWNFMSKMPTIVCKLLGVGLQASATCSATWNLMIAVGILLPLLRGVNQHQAIVMKQNKCIHIFIVLLITTIIVLIPAIGNAYGLTDNNASHYGLTKYECWIMKPKYFASAMIPNTIYVTLAILLLIYSLLVIFFKNDQFLSRFKSQVIWYTAVFVCIWVPTIINRFYNQFFDSSSFILTCIQMISLHCIGCGNAAIWHHYMRRRHLNSNHSSSEQSGTNYMDGTAGSVNAESASNQRLLSERADISPHAFDDNKPITVLNKRQIL